VKLNDTDVKSDYDLVLNQGTLTIREAVDPPIPGDGTFPPDFDTWVTKINAALPLGYNRIQTMYDQYFIDGNLTMVNKSAVYYDPAKFLFELSELAWPDVTEDMRAYAVKAADILNKWATDHGTTGYERFTKGMSYLYHNTGEQKWKDAILTMASQANFAWILPSPSHPDFMMNANSARTVAYGVSILIDTLKAGIDIFPHLNNTSVKLNLELYLNYAFNHHIQWRDKTVPINPQYPQYQYPFIQPFIMGLSMMSLIEFYERVYPDERIPEFIKSTLDTISEYALYTLQPGDKNYIPGHLTAWYFLLLIDGEYVPDTTQGVPWTMNIDMNLAAPYAWYANWLKNNAHSSSDISLAADYMDKGVRLWQGYIANGYIYETQGLLWQGARYVKSFIEFWRNYNGITCTQAITQCISEETCEVHGNWTGEQCQHEEVAVPVSDIEWIDVIPDIPEDPNNWSSRPPAGTLLRTDGTWQVQGLVAALALNEGLGSTIYLEPGTVPITVPPAITLDPEGGLDFSGSAGAINLGIAAPSGAMTVIIWWTNGDLAGPIVRFSTANIASYLATIPVMTTRRPLFAMANENYKYFNTTINPGDVSIYTVTIPGNALDDISDSKFYINGNEIEVYSVSKKVVQGARENLRLSYTSASPYAANGHLDFFAVYNRVLTVSEIKSMSLNPWKIYQPASGS
jgi:hypothetical protein